MLFTTKMKLYGTITSPFVRHVRVALAQSGFDYTLVEADFAVSAEQSPTAKVPYFTDGSLRLTDSSSILKYVREKSGAVFLQEVEDFELYVMSNTLIDAAINQFILESDGATGEQFPYLARQGLRVQKGLQELNRRIDPSQGITQDSTLRCACLLGWGLFRNRFTLEGLDNLSRLWDVANQDHHFAATAPG